MNKTQTRKLKELEKESARLKKLVAGLSLDNAIHKEVLSKKGDQPGQATLAVEHVQQVLEVSEQRSCRLIGRPLSAQRYSLMIGDDEEILIEQNITLASPHGLDGSVDL